MRSTRRWATVPAVARNERGSRTQYTVSRLVSRARLKEGLGEMLLALQVPLDERTRDNFWRAFESGLKKYLELPAPQTAMGKGGAP